MSKTTPNALSLLDFTPVPRKRMRRGGWSEERQRAFIELLAELGSVRAACRRLGASEHYIYKLRAHPDGASFRKAWEAALDIGIQRIEDVAMDRALNGVEMPVYHAGELVGTRRAYNDRLLMFMLKNRSPGRFGEGRSGRRRDAISKMKLKQLKREWQEKWEEERSRISIKDVHASIERKVESVRQAVETEKRREWESLSEETRAAWARFEELKKRDLGGESAIPQIGYPSLPEPAESDSAEPVEASEQANSANVARSIKDDGWD